MEHRASEEPAVAEMLRDPIVRAAMARDRVEPEEVRRLMADMRARLFSRPGGPADA
jgi:hypothetical protein